MRSRAAPLVLLVCTAAGCYGARPPGGLGYPDAGAPPDARLPDGAPDPCRLPNGTLLCGTEDCDFSPCPECRPWGMGIYLMRPPHGVCLRADDLLTAAGFAAPCVGEAVFLSTPSAPDSAGTCAHLQACAAIASLPWWQPEWGACFYIDGTPVTTGLPRTEPCPGLEDVACGPGCADCPAGTACLGPSEASGLGICVPINMRTIWLARDWCGASEALGSRSCEPGKRCVRFATAPDPRLPPSEVLGECLPAEACERLARLRPDRFRCE